MTRDEARRRLDLFMNLADDHKPTRNNHAPVLTEEVEEILSRVWAEVAKEQEAEIATIAQANANYQELGE